MEEEEKLVWYRIWIETGRGHSHIEEIYRQYPKSYTKKDMKDVVEDWAQREKDGWTHDRYKYGFDKVKKPPKEWMEKRRSGYIKDIIYLRTKIDMFTVLLGKQPSEVLPPMSTEEALYKSEELDRREKELLDREKLLIEQEKLHEEKEKKSFKRRFYCLLRLRDHSQGLRWMGGHHPARSPGFGSPEAVIRHLNENAKEYKLDEAMQIFIVENPICQDVRQKSFVPEDEEVK